MRCWESLLQLLKHESGGYGGDTIHGVEEVIVKMVDDDIKTLKLYGEVALDYFQ